MKSVNPVSWNRFRSRLLYVVPEVVGRKHKFSYDDHLVTVSLPTLDKLTSIDDLMTAADHQEILLTYNSYKEENGEKRPNAYWVRSVDVTVDYSRTIKVPNKILNKPPNAYSLLTKKKQSQLNKVADEQEGLARKAFDYWLKVVRWKTDKWAIGRPEVKGYESGWGTYLLDKSTQKQFWIGGNIIQVRLRKPITLQEWNKVGRLVRKGEQSPLHFDSYFDALEHLELGDLDRCIIDLAVSCESVMRGVIGNSLPPNLLNSINKYIDSAKINNFTDKFIPDLLKETKRESFRQIKKDITNLFAERNAILHAKKKNSTSLDDCQRFVEATRKLINLLPQSK